MLGTHKFLLGTSLLFTAMSPSNRPDPLARLLGHVVVGSLAFYLFGRRSGATGLAVTVLTIAAHETFDAPIAQKFSDLGV